MCTLCIDTLYTVCTELTLHRKGCEKYTVCIQYTQWWELHRLHLWVYRALCHCQLYRSHNTLNSQTAHHHLLGVPKYALLKMHKSVSCFTTFISVVSLIGSWLMMVVIMKLAFADFYFYWPWCWWWWFLLVIMLIFIGHTADDFFIAHNADGFDVYRP